MRAQLEREGESTPKRKSTIHDARRLLGLPRNELGSTAGKENLFAVSTPL